MTYRLFGEKSDVAIFFSLCVILYTELFFGQIVLNLYNSDENRKWYNTVSEKIKGMPKRIVFPIVWAILYMGILIGTYLYYKGETYPNEGFMIDTITIIFVTNTMLIKMWPFVLFQLRKTILALIIMIIIVMCTTAMTVLFGLAEEWYPFIPFSVLTLWCYYMLYLNSVWLYVETHYLRTTSI